MVTKWLLQYTHPHVKWHSEIGAQKLSPCKSLFIWKQSVPKCLCVCGHIHTKKHPAEFPLHNTGQSRIPCLPYANHWRRNEFTWLAQTDENSFPEAGLRASFPEIKGSLWTPNLIYLNKIGILMVRKKERRDGQQAIPATKLIIQQQENGEIMVFLPLTTLLEKF